MRPKERGFSGQDIIIGGKPRAKGEREKRSSSNFFLPELKNLEQETNNLFDSLSVGYRKIKENYKKEIIDKAAANGEKIDTATIKELTEAYFKNRTDANGNPISSWQVAATIDENFKKDLEKWQKNKQTLLRTDRDESKPTKTKKNATITEDITEITANDVTPIQEETLPTIEPPPLPRDTDEEETPTVAATKNLPEELPGDMDFEDSEKRFFTRGDAFSKESDVEYFFGLNMDDLGDRREFINFVANIADDYQLKELAISDKLSKPHKEALFKHRDNLLKQDSPEADQFIEKLKTMGLLGRTQDERDIETVRAAIFNAGERNVRLSDVGSPAPLVNKPGYYRKLDEKPLTSKEQDLPQPNIPEPAAAKKSGWRERLGKMAAAAAVIFGLAGGGAPTEKSRPEEKTQPTTTSEKIPAPLSEKYDDDLFTEPAVTKNFSDDTKQSITTARKEKEEENNPTLKPKEYKKYKKIAKEKIIPTTNNNDDEGESVSIKFQDSDIKPTFFEKEADELASSPKRMARAAKNLPGRVELAPVDEMPEVGKAVTYKMGSENEDVVTAKSETPKPKKVVEKKPAASYPKPSAARKYGRSRDLAMQSGEETMRDIFEDNRGSIGGKYGKNLGPNTKIKIDEDL